jgi:autotransporter translocation and assembly factor TamB
VDILSYLLFGRPAGELSAQQSTALQERGSLLFGSETTKLLKAILGQTPFTPDVVQFKGTEEGSGVVEIGKYLTPELYVTYEKGLTAGENDQVRAEFEMNRHISVQSQFGREDQSGVDVFFRYDFGD